MYLSKVLSMKNSRTFATNPSDNFAYVQSLRNSQILAAQDYSKSYQKVVVPTPSTKCNTSYARLRYPQENFARDIRRNIEVQASNLQSQNVSNNNSEISNYFKRVSDITSDYKNCQPNGRIITMDKRVLKNNNLK